MRSFIILSFLVISGMIAFGQNVVQVEYALDTDAGVGNNTLVTVTAAPDGNFSFNVDVSKTTQGFHILYVRTKDTRGNWSHTTRESIQVAPAILQTSVVTGEYSIDMDAGFGLNTAFTATTGTDGSTPFSVNTTGLTQGYHVLYLRTKDSNGNWGQTNRISFQSYSASTNKLVSAEYFFDTDPGYGSGTSLALTTQGTDVTQSLTAAVSTLTEGYHKLYLRFKDANGAWSQTARQNVDIIKQAATLKIAAAEFFFKKDPGTGKGIQLTVPTPQADGSLILNIPANTKSADVDTLYLRVRDNVDTTRWSFVRWNPITKAAQTIKFAALPSKAYGNADFSPGATSSSTLPVSYSSSDTTIASIVSGNIHIKKPGTVTITASQGGNISFKVAPGLTQALTITKASQSIAYTAVPAQTYGAADIVLNGKASSGLAVTYTSSNTSVATILNGSIHIVGAGTSVITVSQAGNANYFAATAVTQTLSVNTALITVTATNASKTYGAANPVFTATYTGFVNGDTQAKISTLPVVSTTATATSAVGSYPVTASGAVSANYSFAYVAGTLTVNKAPLTITAVNASKTYGAANPTLAVTYTGFVNGDTQTKLTTLPSLTTTATGASVVGSYPITASGAVAANYAITYVAGTLTINKAALTITAANSSKIYGAANPTLAVTYTGFVNGDTQTKLTTQPSLTTTATSAAVVGSYPITASGAVAANYTITYVAGTLTINKASLTITAANTSKTYGATNPTLAVTYTGFVNGDTQTKLTTQPSLTTTATSASVVGSYPITASGAVAANYTIAYVAGTLTINKASLTITAANKTKTVGSVNPTLTVTYAGFVNGNTSASLTSQPVITTTATTTSPVGTYPITVSGAVAANYSISYVAGVLTITALIPGSIPKNLDLFTVQKLALDSTVVTAPPSVKQVLSPNGDGINDVLVINNIEKYPDNKLTLVNSNGVEIYRVSGYDNINRVFDGHSMHTHAMQLPGTYFYLLEYQDNGVLKRKAGYFLIKY